MRQGYEGRRHRLAGPYVRLRRIAPGAGLAEKDGGGEKPSVDEGREEDGEEDIRDSEESAADHGHCAVFVKRVHCA